MKTAIRTILICIVAALSQQSFAANALGPSLATPGKLLFEDDFSRSEMKPKWRVGKGDWSVKDGVVTAAENPADKHGAYAYAQPKFQFKDIIAEYSVKLDGSRACNLMINDSNYKESHAGHILRATVLPGKVSVADYKYGSMKNEIFEKNKDPKTTPEEKKKLAESIKDKQAAFKTDADMSQWHQVRVEIVGDEMLVSIDGKPTAYIKSAGIGHETKNAIGFEIGGKSTELENFKVWEATASPRWSAHRDAVVSALTKG